MFFRVRFRILLYKAALLSMLTFVMSACVKEEDHLNDHADSPVEVGIDDRYVAISDSMLMWLEGMQLSNGLLETSRQSSLISLYDNALSALVFTRTNRIEKAQQIFSYFQNRLYSEFSFGNGGFFQFRNSSGQPQGNRWLGDNAWFLIALNNYEEQTGDLQYAAMRDSLEGWIRRQQDTDGGLWGGTDQSGSNIGKVTEAMIDAFNAVDGFDAFHAGILDYLHQERWDEADQLLVSWPGSNYYYALDNLSWGYCAFEGFPERVLTDADRFLNTQWHAHSADSITGYCFDEDRDAVWIEGSAQMAIAFAKAGNYDRANAILHELSKVSANDPVSAGTQGLPYASNLGTGYGNGLLWQGADVNPCTVAAAWFIMAAHNFDPFKVGYAKGIPTNSKFW